MSDAKRDIVKMAELLGLLGLGFAAPGLLKVLYEAGESIVQRTKDVRDYDQNVQRYQQVGVNISSGLIRTQVELVLAAIRDQLLPDDIKQQLDQAFQDIVQAIIDVDEEVKKSLRKSLSGKLQILVLGQKLKLNSRLKLLEEQQQLFERCANYVNLYRAIPRSYKLNSRKFCIRGETNDDLPGSFLPHSDVFVTSGELSQDGVARTIDVVIEESFYNKREQEQGEDDIRGLVSQLQLAKFLTGVPKCLGYRQGSKKDKFDLIFELPPNNSVRSLADTLTLKDPPPLEARLTLCQMLASSISDVHGLNLVHKNIRPRTILVVNPDALSRPTGLVLTNWTVVRSVNDASVWRGEDMWERAIYQHPARFGAQAEEHYTFGHDVYSLGVSMLEIVMWRPLVVQSISDLSGGHSLSQDFQKRAKELAPQYDVSVEQAGVEDRVIRYPQLVRAVIADLARSELPRVAGSRIAHAVIKALGDGQDADTRQYADRQQHAVDLGVKYLRDVLLVLNSVSI